MAAQRHSFYIGLFGELIDKFSCNFCVVSEIDLPISKPSCAGSIVMLVCGSQDVPVPTSEIEGPIGSISLMAYE